MQYLLRHILKPGLGTLSVTLLFCATVEAQNYIYQIPETPSGVFLDIDGITDSRLAGGVYIPTKGGAPQAFLFDGFQFQLFSPPAEFGLGADVGGMNNLGHLVGEAGHEDGRSGSFLFRDDLFSFLHISGSSRTNATGINDRGTVVGFVQPGEDKGGDADQGFIWKDGEFQIHAVAGFENTWFIDIDNFGIILAAAFDSPVAFRYFLFDGTEFTPIEIAVPGAARTLVATMNDWGVVAGTYWADLNSLEGKPFLYDGETYTKLEGFAGDATVKAINNNFDLVGRQQDPNEDAVGFVGFFRDNDDILQPSGDLVVHVSTEAPVVGQAGNKIDTTTATLYLQDQQLRQQMAGESDKNYLAFLESQPRRLESQIVTAVADDGQATFSDIPVFQLQSRSGRQFVERAYYTLNIRNTSTDECALDKGECSETQRVFFTNATFPNITLDQSSTAELATLVLPLDAIGQKRSLIDTLIRLGPENYQMVETEAGSVVNEVADTPTPAGLECVRRSVYAERLAASSARFSQALLNDMLGGMESLVHDLIDDVLVSKSKRLQESSKQYEELTEKLDLGKLESLGWPGFATGDEATKNKIFAQMRILRDNNQNLEISLLAEVAQLVSNAVFSAVNFALVRAQMEESVAAATAKDFKDYVDSLLQLAINQGASGAAPLAKRLISEITKANRANLFDSPVPYAYTALTEDSLSGSSVLMDGCDVANPEGFEADRSNYNLVEQQVGELRVVSKSITAFSTEIADAFGGQGAEIIGLLGPKGRAVKKILDVTKYVSNSITFGVPALTVYGGLAGPNISVTSPWLLPGGLGSTLEIGLLEKGTKAIYGVTELPSKSNFRPPPGYGVRQLDTESAMPKQAWLVNRIEESANDLVTALTSLITDLNSNQFVDVVETVGGDSGESVLAAQKEFAEAVSNVAMLVQSTPTDDPQSTAQIEGFAAQRAEFGESWARTLTQLDALIYRVLLAEVSVPEASRYLAERNHVAGEILKVITRIDVLTNAAHAALDLASQMPGLPVISFFDLHIVSDDSGESSISENGETFRLTVVARNLGNTDQNGLSALLSTSTEQSQITFETPAMQSIGNGTLDAADGVDGSGLDEIELEWVVSFTGDPEQPASIPLYVDVLENADPPVSFRPGAGVAILETSLAITDTDQDGLPDHWEQANGLNVGLDDSQSDTDSDLLSNEREFQLGTFPTVADSDEDGVPDGHEVLALINSFPTNPLNTDTDDDGVSDLIDGSPLDNSTSQPPPPQSLPGEPGVAVDNTLIMLSQDDPVATVFVSNAGSGLLNWAAFTTDEFIAVTRPSPPAISVGDGMLSIRAANTFEFDRFEPLTTTVRVMDISGHVRDYRDITIVVGRGADQIFADNFEL